MKKMLLSALLALTGFTTNAQIEDGSIAPDFTVTDVFGVTHSLSQYLSQGKTVIMDISATWCAPCWSFHNSGMLEQVYYSQGQGGSGEVVILLVETDEDTDEQCLFGICPDDFTQGNWVQNTPYPVINSDEIGQLYQIQYFPTLFMICPSGIITEMTPSGAQELMNDISASCGASQGIQKNAHPHIDDMMVCEEGQVAPHVSLTNYGTETITGATLKIFDGQTVLATKNFTGNIIPFTEEDVVFDPVAIATGQDYTVKVTAINNTAPLNTTATVSSFSVALAPQSVTNITVKINTDLYPGDISWAIKNSAGTVVASGGPYQAGTDDSFGAGGPDANTTKVQEVALPSNSTDCYQVEMYDNWGDGWLSAQTAGSMEIWSGNNKIFDKEGRFESQLITPAAFKTNGQLSNPVQQETVFALYPVPSTGILQFKGVETADVIITDMAGKVVYTASGVENNAQLNLSALQKGVYLTKVTSGSTMVLQKIILN
jgi:Secretion system C-terminal sorting domain